MGANLTSRLGTPEAALAAAAVRLGTLGRVTRRSGLYSTTPVGYAAQPRFTNAVVALETALAPFELLEGLMAIEKEFGRDRTKGMLNGPRTLDLDILLMGDFVLHEARLEIPHPRLAERAFVLVPLNEIAPEAVVPRHNRTVAQLLDALTQHNQHNPDNRDNKDDKGDADGVVRIESEIWRAGLDAGGASTVRGGSDEPDAHG